MQPPSDMSLRGNPKIPARGAYLAAATHAPPKQPMSCLPTLLPRGKPGARSHGLHTRAGAGVRLSLIRVDRW
jgi:hypothetical protein